MAKHGRGRARRSFNLRRVRVATTVGLGALLASDVITGVITNTSTDPYRIVTADLTFSLVNVGNAADDGQEFGLSHSDYTAAEVEECLEAGGSIDLGNKIAQEQANRLVRTIGVMTGDPVAGAGMDFNDGKPKKTKLNWRMSTGKQLALWIRNGSSVNYTTGAGLRVQGNLWIKDV